MTIREIIAQALAEADGYDPDSYDVMLICTNDNEPLPVWQAFEEPADAVIAALEKAGVSLASAQKEE